MKIQGKDALREILAAEYVLGTLKGHARRRFESWLRDDPGLRALTAKWQAHFAPLASGLEPVRPPDAVWRGITQRIPVLAAREPVILPWYENLMFWRFWSALSTGVAAGALVALGVAFVRMSGPQAPQVAFVAPAQTAHPAYIATIADEKTGRALALLVMPENGNEVVLKVVSQDVSVPQGKALQLWMANPSGAAGVVSAGMVPGSEEGAAVRFSVPDANDFRHAPVIGLSLEPLGGSPSATHVIGFGKWSKVVS